MGQIQPPSDKNRTQQSQKKGQEKSPSDKDTARMTPASPAAAARHRAESDEPMDEEGQLEADDESENEGEGSRTAARNYNQGLKQNMAKGQTEEDAKRAERAIEGPEGEELKRAEQEGKRGEPRHSH